MLPPALAYGLYLTGVGAVPADKRRLIPSYCKGWYGLRPPSQVRYRTLGKGDPLWR
jgi:hypothetical protein